MTEHSDTHDVADRGHQPYLFVSYSHLDEKDVLREIRRLRELGFRVFYDSGVTAGSEWSESLARAILGCSHFLFFITPRSVESENCRRELTFAIAESRRVLAVHLEETPLPHGLRLSLDNRQAIYRYKHGDAEFERRLVAALGRDGAGTSPAPADIPTPRRIGSTVAYLSAAVALVAVALSAAWYWWGAESATAPVKKIAVLPCDNLSPNADDAYLAAGMHEELLSRLAQIPDLLVVARTSVLRYQQSRPTIPQIADELDASAVMECSVQVVGNNLQVRTLLIDPASNAPIWSSAYPADLSDLDRVFKIQQDIAINVASAMDMQLSGTVRSAEPPTRSPEAYASFLRALANEPLERMAPLDRAIDLDPEFAMAYAQRSLAHMAQADFARVVPGATPFDLGTEFRLAWADAENALSIDPNLGLAHLVLATRRVWPEYDERAAYAALERALDYPQSRESLWLAANIYLHTLDPGNARSVIDRLSRIDPNYRYLGFLWWSVGDVDPACAHERKLLEWDGSDPVANYGLAVCEATRGNVEVARRHLRIAREIWRTQDAETPVDWSQVYIFGRLGMKDAAERLFKAATEQPEWQPPSFWIFHHLGVGDEESAFQTAKRVVEQKDRHGAEPRDPQYMDGALVSFALNAPQDPVFDEPRFLELRRKLGYRE